MSGASFDIVIAGGGLVGASLACALEHSRLRVAMVEAVSPGAAMQPSYDDRTLSLSRASCDYLQHCGIWQHLPEATSAIEKIHVSSRGEFGVTRLDAKEHGVDWFGQVVRASALGDALQTRMQECANLTIFRPATVTAYEVKAESTSIFLHTATEQLTLQSKLLVAADGSRSGIRDLAGIGCKHKDYKLQAIIANVTPATHHQQTAYERLTDTGPFALLPLADGRCGLVWTMAAGEETQYLDCADDIFLAAIQARFGMRLGYFEKVGKRQAYPLHLLQPHKLQSDRMVLIGNAAHTVSPVSAQGLNLGLRDVAGLVETVSVAEDCGAPAVLHAYAEDRMPDQRKIMQWTDGLLEAFRSPTLLAKLLRNSAMLGLDLLPPLKSRLVQSGMGYVQ